MIVDDEEIALKALKRILQSEGYDVEAVSTGKKAIKLINTKQFDLILTDLFIDEIDGLDVLAAAKNRDPDTAVILLTGHGSIDSAIEATKKEAFHYLQKPIRPDEVRHIVKRAVENLELIARIKELETKSSRDVGSIIGNSPKIVDVKKLIRRIEDSESNVLIVGETGTGKELVARAIHEFSPKKRGRFLAFNCASFTEDLLANELFGHEKDAFTGATKSRAGLFESANGGTVFLDEVGDMPMTMQVKLLRVIQEREVLRVGGNSSIPIDVRIIAATNQDLKKQSTTGTFRQDLFFRLNVINIHMPSLNERTEDIPLLASHFLRYYSKKIDKQITGFTDEVVGLLSGYQYPGNIRELENIVEHAVSMTHGETIKAESLPKDLMDNDLFMFQGQTDGFKTLEELEKEYIRWILDKVENKKTAASKILGIDRASLYRKLKRFKFDN